MRHGGSANSGYGEISRACTFTCRTRDGDLISGDTTDLIQRHLYFFGIWEPHISHWVARTLRSGDVFVDVGANIGHYSLLAAHRVGASGGVVAIEAAPWIATMLAANVTRNRHRNVRIVPVAASAARGELPLFPGQPNNIGKTTTIANAGESIRVPALPLSQILSEDEVRRARLIKIDVEGAELDVLHGLAPLFTQLRDEVQLIVEVSPTLLPGGARACDEIFALLRAQGFRAYALDNDYGIDTYLRRDTTARPRPLSAAPQTAQTDVLFTRLPIGA